jgi:hypothetical protein
MKYDPVFGDLHPKRRPSYVEDEIATLLTLAKNKRESPENKLTDNESHILKSIVDTPPPYSDNIISKEIDYWDNTININIDFPFKDDFWKYRPSCKDYKRMEPLDFSFYGVSFHFETFVISDFLYMQLETGSVTSIVCEIEIISDHRISCQIKLGGVVFLKQVYMHERASFMYNAWVHTTEFVKGRDIEEENRKRTDIEIANDENGLLARIASFISSPFAFINTNKQKKYIEEVNTFGPKELCTLVDDGKIKIDDILSDNKRKFVESYLHNYYKSLEDIDGEKI